MTSRTALCATGIAAASLVLGVTACSRQLEIRIFNSSGSAMRVCSEWDGGRQCLDLGGDAASGVLAWNYGAFTVDSDGCKRRYEVEVPNINASIDYRESRSSPVNAVVAPDYRLFLVRNGHRPEAASEASQPTGFPVVPVAQGSGCK